MFSCQSCKKQFSSILAVTQHGKDVHKTQPEPAPALVHKCKTCQRLLSTSTGLKDHCHSVHEKPCQICDIMFTTDSGLKKHQRLKHTNTPTPAPAPVPTNSHTDNLKFFSTQQPLEIPRTSYPEHICQSCGFTCALKRDIEKHLAVKHDLWSCIICQQTFGSLGAVEDHVRHKHQVPCKICGKSSDSTETLKGHTSVAPEHKCKPVITEIFTSKPEPHADRTSAMETEIASAVLDALAQIDDSAKRFAGVTDAASTHFEQKLTSSTDLFMEHLMSASQLAAIVRNIQEPIVSTFQDPRKQVADYTAPASVSSAKRKVKKDLRSERIAKLPAVMSTVCMEKDSSGSFQEDTLGLGSLPTSPSSSTEYMSAGVSPFKDIVKEGDRLSAGVFAIVEDNVYYTANEADTVVTHSPVSISITSSENSFDDIPQSERSCVGHPGNGHTQLQYGVQKPLIPACSTVKTPQLIVIKEGADSYEMCDLSLLDMKDPAQERFSSFGLPLLLTCSVCPGTFFETPQAQAHHKTLHVRIKDI